jgi:hypothetical protein
MIIVRNEKLVKRNKNLGRICGFGSILILGAGMYLSFKFPNQIMYSLAALMVGVAVSQVGIFYANKFGRTPRPDQDLDAALKGLDDQYVLYHYQSPVDHLLVGPPGIWMLLPYSQGGKIIYDQHRKRWKKTGRNLFTHFLGQDQIGRPDAEIAAGLKRLEKDFAKVPELSLPPIQAAVVFTNEKVEVEAEDTPYPTLHARQLKKLVRKEAKGEYALSTTVMITIQDHLGRESIV